MHISIKATAGLWAMFVEASERAQAGEIATIALDRGVAGGVDEIRFTFIGADRDDLEDGGLAILLQDVPEEKTLEPWLAWAEPAPR